MNVKKPWRKHVRKEENLRNTGTTTYFIHGISVAHDEESGLRECNAHCVAINAGGVERNV